MTTITLDNLTRDIDNFLAFKRALGYRYARGEATLRSFERFAYAHAGRGATGRPKIVLAPTVEAFLTRIVGRKAVTVANELGALRQLCLYRRRRDPHGYVPEHGWAPQTESVYLPYIFSREEIRDLLDAAKRHCGRNIPGPMLHTLLLVLYCTGLRFGEAVRLRLSDVDLRRCTFLIRESKGRTRLVPFGEDLARELNAYLGDRVRTAGAAVDALFVRKSGSALTLGSASEAVRRLLRQRGLKPAAGRLGPRPYDFRHAYAVHRLTEWYHAGVDIHARLPWLSAYMGHVNVLGTEVYLHATPELLQLASDRIADRLNRPRSTP
jgi:integrase/recombinase XerD